MTLREPNLEFFKNKFFQDYSDEYFSKDQKEQKCGLLSILNTNTTGVPNQYIFKNIFSRTIRSPMVD